MANNMPSALSTMHLYTLANMEEQLRSLKNNSYHCYFIIKNILSQIDKKALASTTKLKRGIFR